MKIIISGGGTGGHIFPALSIGAELRRRFPAADILFVGALGRMEMERVPAAGFRIVGLPVSGMPRKVSLRWFRFVYNLILSMVKAFRLIHTFRPDVVVGVGGYASGPILRAALHYNIPVVLQEQNCYAGVTNRMLAARVNAVCVAYDGMQRFFPHTRLVLTGNPVRKELLSHIDRQTALDAFGLEAGLPTVMLTGGSLGAATLNRCIIKGLDRLRQSNIQLLWQTGKQYYADIKALLGDNCPPNVKPVEFISNMGMAYSAADLVISRAGAGAIAELSLLGKPCILVPSPNVAEDHQTVNANALVNRAAAILITDAQAPETLVETAIDTCNNELMMKTLSKNIKALAKPNATDDITDIILETIKHTQS
ncbi:MAG: undecaprenyldiphospho-muramoylpentapeptide beta-N-acetylglucosaminyltransferase [Bacteroidales bacterium]|jgi:UDP-N-acetylglucosamine--N-acetylmuramyl-(pentapeptide) pyrophosphoryl-undecaprenol N-acetylglucosamine transferase|nr:undecaprenyldiphospho-muramoylpentapeptide beta-N-acetylglucosaminyltransferase [Bacteroidales bacterium]